MLWDIGLIFFPFLENVIISGETLYPLINI